MDRRACRKVVRVTVVHVRIARLLGEKMPKRRQASFTAVVPRRTAAEQRWEGPAHDREALWLLAAAAQEAIGLDQLIPSQRCRGADVDGLALDVADVRPVISMLQAGECEVHPNVLARAHA
ncbi:MAG TPA: hypothetical protein DDZ42_18325 [Candidatus Rokubacteria bacterium]|nr:hypothetical protein [Candidatus Rokubacteria bacterium]